MPDKQTDIIHVATECTPFFKTGGLADVIGSLPQALDMPEGAVTVILPKHRNLSEEWIQQLNWIHSLSVWVKWRQQTCQVYELTHQKVRYLFLENDYYFNRPSLYGDHDDGERYAFFCHAILEWVQHMKQKPSIIHCHDWQTSLIPAYIRAKSWDSQIKTVVTIHNLAYQGQFPPSVFKELLHFDDQAYPIIEMDDHVNYLKAGIAEADRITTVSPSYSNEIQQPEFGYKLDSLLRQRSADLTGIVNGIDLIDYNPAQDKELIAPYSSRSLASDINKRSLQVEAGLSMSISTPLFAVVSRLVPEKGIALLIETLNKLLDHERIQVIVLGSGSHELEQALFSLEHRFPKKLSFFHGFDEAKARRIYAGADMLLMPSLFEPCGLSQLISLRYGCVPVVRATGGLKDTIQPFHPHTGTGNGFTFHTMSSGDLRLTIIRAISIFHNKTQWNKLLTNGAATELSWKNSAKLYHIIYDGLRERKGVWNQRADQSEGVQRNIVKEITSCRASSA
ncbi:glycogen synthase [Alkalicoccobacillus murimartini]|uniref:Glycogen synthase n=1 Tax=Alkalicoccobacillus murimartini TaxID=171685 RepID=A0ABT9YBR5_9BACI|nr:glycogen/starch synthase [Alkalicoccobacillus murimartini]MDQ0205280.1 starch synthase [Alkalicoccobacillus murimartini]